MEGRNSNRGEHQEKRLSQELESRSGKSRRDHTIEVDRLMSNDGTTHLTIDMYHNQLKHPKIADKDKLVFIMDHNVPRRIQKQQQHIERCVILQKSMKSNYMKEKVSASDHGREQYVQRIYHGCRLPYVYIWSFRSIWYRDLDVLISYTLW